MLVIIPSIQMRIMRLRERKKLVMVTGSTSGHIGLCVSFELPTLPSAVPPTYFQVSLYFMLYYVMLFYFILFAFCLWYQYMMLFTTFVQEPFKIKERRMSMNT